FGMRIAAECIGQEVEPEIGYRLLCLRDRDPCKACFYTEIFTSRAGIDNAIDKKACSLACGGGRTRTCVNNRIVEPAALLQFAHHRRQHPCSKLVTRDADAFIGERVADDRPGFALFAKPRRCGHANVGKESLVDVAMADETWNAAHLDPGRRHGHEEYCDPRLAHRVTRAGKQKAMFCHCGIRSP